MSVASVRGVERGGAAGGGEINGVDVEALGEVAAGVRRDPALVRVSFRVRTDWGGGARARTSVESWTVAGVRRARCHTIASDEPPELGGTNTAPNPQELLLAAVNSCIVVGFVFEAARRGIELRSLRLETEGDLDLRGFMQIDESVPPGPRSVRVRVIAQAEARESALREVLQAALRYSPNRWGLAMPVDVEAVLAVGG